MAEIRSFTIEGTGLVKAYQTAGDEATSFTTFRSISDGIHNITVPIKAGSTLLLVNSRIDINYGTAAPRADDMIRSVNLLIGNTVTNYYVVDNNDKLNALKIKLKHNPVTVGVKLAHDGATVDRAFNISDYEPNCAYKIGADMNSRIEISFRDESGRPLGANPVAGGGEPLLAYYFLQFQVL
jgi:hypothetical protein